MKSFRDRMEWWRLGQAAAKTGMFGIGHERNRKWRIAEAERRMFGDSTEPYST